MRRKLGFELPTGRAVLVLDKAENKKRLDSSALVSATPWPCWTGRQLGHIKMFSATDEVVWVLTANNPRLSRELARRCAGMRIDSRVDRPWLRTSFQRRSDTARARPRGARGRRSAAKTRSSPSPKRPRARLCEIARGRDSWPGGSPQSADAGLISKDFSANRVILDSFAAH